MLDLNQIKLDYDAKYHRDLPHVVKFSGGRSSGMMLIALLEQGLLDAKRGDVVLFNNTSAEHPATYDFVRKCKSFTEEKHNIPFFWIEYATYEVAYNGDWTRQSSFRLVHDTPFEKKNPNGYHWRGEVFEEMVSIQGFLPSRHTRNCTAHLKLQCTYDFLAEWFAVKDTTFRLGHYYDESQVTDDSLLEKHRKSRGKLEKNDLLKKRAYSRSRPLFRPAQIFNDYSITGSKFIKESQLASKSLGDVAVIKGEEAIEYVSIVGLRSDEKRRVIRVKQRNKASVAEFGQGKPYENEIVSTPLADSNITQEDVVEFWKLWPWDLELPHEANLSNCVYCFMKGSKSIARISHDMEHIDRQLREEIRSVPDTPSDINWWIGLEEMYRRRAATRNSNKSKAKTVSIGFWGVDAKESYQKLKDLEQEESEEARSLLNGRNALPCDCTD